MAKGLITHAYLEDTADAIRVLRGESNTYTPDEFGEKIIDKIPTEEVTDDIVSVHDAAAYPAEGLEFAIEPVQDLHGYDKPWPAGGGKNLCPVASGEIKGGNLVTFTNPLPSGTYSISLNATRTGESANVASIIVYDKDDVAYTGRAIIPNTGERNKIENENFNNGISRIYFYSIIGSWKESQNYTLNITDFQLELGSTATSYEPYANECPISGWTECNGERTSVNVWDEEWARYSATQIKSKNLIKVNPNTNYYIKSPVMIGITYFNSEMEIINTEYTSNNTITIPSNAQCLSFITTTRYDSDTYNHDISINYPATDTEYHAYTGTSIPITFPTEAGTVYGGKVDVVNGKLLAYPEYDSYNGETLTGEWISSMDAYVEGTTPTIGAQVVDLSGVGTEYDITPQQVQMLLGDNNVWCDTGDTTLEYKVDLGRFIEKLQAAQVTPQLSLSRQAVSLDAPIDVEVRTDETPTADTIEDDALSR